MNDVDQISKSNANHIEGINQPSKADGAQKKWLYALYFFGLLSLLSLAALIYYLNKVTDYVSSINDLEVYSGSMVRDVNEALFSEDPAVKESAYQQLESDISNYETALMSAQESALDNEAFYQDLSQQWLTMKPEVQSVLENSNSFNSLADGTEQVVAAVETIQNLYVQATQQATAVRLGSEQIAQMQQQLIVSEKIAENFENLNSSISTSTADLESVTNTFSENLEAQQQAFGAYVPALLEIEQTFNNMVMPEIRKVTDDNTSIFELRDNTRAVSDLAIKTQNQLAEVNREILTRPRVILPALAFITSLFMGLFSMFQLSRVRDRTERLLIEKETLRQRQDMEVESDRARKIQEENERNQMAILRLLDELGDLAEGDLTVNATVSEDFTGAIADSVNFAIDQLRQLVLAINTTAVRVAQSSEQTQMTAVELAEASEHQAQEIAGVSAAINEMAVSIDQVSSNATESATVAQRSVAIAHNGAEVVQRSIEGMNTIREQIQETSKRIKRLGESSQEIGDIIGLINDIADQTNVLALNAAIQASMAGEAGRGFAVVADEVQRLAERSANATKQIESLVKTIQADTNEAVMSMESTTTEVVRGAGLAKDAGEALEEVQTVSNTLADLIQNISNAAQQQASSAGHISKTMNVIQDITSQTSSGTLATARSVGQLNEMAAALQESVSGFKLDDDEDEVLLQDL